MKKSNRVHFRNVAMTRFANGGKLEYYNVDIDRATGVVRVREKHHREVAILDLATIIRIVMNKHAEAKAREKLAAKKQRRLVKRGLLALGRG